MKAFLAARTCWGGPDRDCYSLEGSGAQSEPWTAASCTPLQPTSRSANSMGQGHATHSGESGCHLGGREQAFPTQGCSLGLRRGSHLFGDLIRVLRVLLHGPGKGAVLGRGSAFTWRECTSSHHEAIPGQKKKKKFYSRIIFLVFLCFLSCQRDVQAFVSRPGRVPKEGLSRN